MDNASPHGSPGNSQPQYCVASTTDEDALRDLREWSYVSGGEFAADYAEFFPPLFEWGWGEADDPIFAEAWENIARLPEVVLMRFVGKPVGTDFLEDWGCILERFRWPKAESALDLGKPDHEALLVLTDEEWFELALRVDAKRIEVAVQDSAAEC